MSGNFNTGVSEVMTSRSSLLLQVAELCSLVFDLNLMARNRPPELSGGFQALVCRIVSIRPGYRQNID